MQKPLITGSHTPHSFPESWSFLLLPPPWALAWLEEETYKQQYFTQSHVTRRFFLQSCLLLLLTAKLTSERWLTPHAEMMAREAQASLNIPAWKTIFNLQFTCRAHARKGNCSQIDSHQKLGSPEKQKQAKQSLTGMTCPSRDATVAKHL